LELLHNPDNGYSNDGKSLPLPEHLKRNLLSWATYFYFEYPFGYSLIQQFFAKKFSIHIWQIHADKPGKLYPASDRPTIAIQAMIEGEIPCVLVGFGQKVLKKHKYELFYVPVSVNEAWLEPGNYESFHIELEPGFLEDIAETYADAMELLTRFENASEKGIPMIAVNISYVARAIISNIRSCDKQGGDLVIQLHQFIVDLLSEYITGIQQQEKDEKLIGIAHKEVLMRIKHEILADPNIMNLELKKLSKKFGLSITELKKGFKSLFDKTPGAFIRYHALYKAHYLLTTTNQGVDDIAGEVGYGYRSNFDKAFKKQFGFLPASLRQKM
jgi:AraC-like DNA-binding protein